MKTIHKIFLLAIMLAVTAYIAQHIHHQRKQPKSQLFTTEKPKQRIIRHVISTSGTLEIKEIMKVGSIQAGCVKEILVVENERVKKDQLLAIIDTGKSDTEVQAAQHRVFRAREEYDYQKLYHERQTALYKSGQLSHDAYQRITKELNKSHEELKTEEALLAKVTMEYESTLIKAPEDGIIIASYATKGMIANDVSNIVLFEIAQDITQMKATLDIDESEIGHIKNGQKIILTPNSFPEMHIKSTIADVSYVPRHGSNTRINTDGPSLYTAHSDINNKDHALHPGMIVNGHIKINKAKHAPSISVLAFYVNTISVEAAAQKLNYSYEPIAEHDQKRIIKKNPQSLIKFVWVVHNKRFIQKAVTLGLTDSIYWEIKSGLSLDEKILIDVIETDAMDAVYKQWFRGSLS